MGSNGVGRQLEPGFALRAFAANGGAGVRAIFSIGGVLAQGVDEECADAAVARMQDRVLEQAPAEARRRPAAAPTRRIRTCCGRRVGRRAADRQVRHRHQLEPAVEDAEDLVALEVQPVDIARQLPVGGGVAEAQVARVVVESQQVLMMRSRWRGPSERIGTQRPRPLAGRRRGRSVRRAGGTSDALAASRMAVDRGWGR